jgi:hypothetical protein
MQKSIWSIGLFWFYVELFHLLLYKYLDGVGADADGWGSFAIDVFWWQQFDITFIWFRFMSKCAHPQRSTIIIQRVLKNESFNRRISVKSKNY